MRDWRLIALDLDGTLLDDDGLISDENRKWIRTARDEGIEVTIATGRPVHFVKPIIDSLGLVTPFVTANGSEVWTVKNQLLDRHTFTTEQVSKMHRLALRYGVKFWFSVADRVLKPGVLPNNIEDYRWLKFGYSIETNGMKERLWEELNGYQTFEVTSSGVYNIEVNPLGVSKASGLQVVCKHMGIAAEQVVTIGDGLNDIAMLKWAGLGIAMENAPDSVKREADCVTTAYSKHGVGKAIENLLRC